MAGRVAATRTSRLIPDLSQANLVSPVLRARGINSLVAIPLIVEGSAIGVLHAGSEAFAQFSAEDATLLELIADRIALAINQAALYDAERASQERLRFLGEASTLLGSSLDVDLTLDQLGKLVAGRVADWCAIHLANETGAARLISIAHSDPERAAQAAALVGDAVPSEDATSGVGRVIRTGEPELYPVIPPELVEGPAKEAGIHSCLIVPLQARGRTFGAMSLVWAETAATYDERDRDFALDLARRAAIAIDNAQLYRAAEEQAQAARVLASVGDGVFLIDRRGFVRTWNRAAAAATGLRADDVVDRLATEAIPGWGEIASRVPMVTAGSASPRAESLPLAPGGRELWLSIHGVVVPDGVVYAFRDLTEERALETMRTEFVSTVSHELRTPLAAIYGAAMTLRRSDVTLDDSQRANLLDVVSAEADRLARTVNDILWASRLDTDSLHVSIQNCDPGTLAADVVQAQLAHLDPGHELVLTLEDGLPNIAGDPDKVSRVLINLVDNAVKYSPDGGRIDVGVAVAGSQVRFSVTDRGLGIPPAEQRRVFEKFYRLDPNMNRGVGGTGLGLYICRELVRRMDGRLWVDSKGLGRGSTFNVELPASAEFARPAV
jgi:PAS domain S-box-containing protein